MSINIIVQMLEERINKLDDKIDNHVKEIRERVDRNFKFQNTLICLGSLPTLQALGIPTKEIGGVLIKKALGFLGFIL